MDQELIEEIAENTYSLMECEGKATVEALKRKIDVDGSDIDDALEFMHKENYLKVKDGKIIFLPKGRKLGRRIVRKHRLLERFLHNVLGLKKDEVHKEACKLEHALSDDAEEALDKFLNHPRECPDDGRPIPPPCPRECECRKCGPESGFEVSLTEIEVGQVGRIRAIKGGRKAVQRLHDMGLVPNVCVTVLKKAPFHGPLELEVCGTKLALGRNIAAKVIVEV